MIKKTAKKILNVPNLRFPGFEGEWNSDILGNIFYISAGGDIAKENVREIKNDEFPYPIYANAEKNKGLYGYSNIYKIKENVITVAGRGVNIGITHARDHKFYPIVRLLVLKPKNDENIRFFEYQINNLNLYKESTGVPQLTAPQISSYFVKFPILSEQLKIASFLSLIDERISTQNKIIEQLKSLIKGVAEKLLTQQLRFKDQNGNDFPKWAARKIEKVLTVGSGKDYKHLKTGNIPVFGTGGLMTYVNSFLYNGETVCIGRKGTIDKPMYYKGKIWTVDTLFYTHSFLDVDPKFIFYVFLKINWKEYNEASGVPSLSKKTIEKIEINIPSLPEQICVSNVLSSIDEKIEIEKRLLRQLEDQKNFLLRNLFI